MQLIRVGAAVLNQTPLDWEGNRRRIVQAIGEARTEGVEILCLPELCITGYGCEDAFHGPGVLETAWTILQGLLPETAGLVVCLGTPILHANGLFNAAAMVCDGRLLGFVPKRFLAGDGIHYEPRWFKPWPTGLVARHTRDGCSWPIGDLYFDCGGIRIGFEICEDAWVATRPGGALSRKGVDLIMNPSASHFAFGKAAVRQRFVLEGSRAFGVTYLYANLLGNEAGRAIYDGGALIASAGKLIAAGPRFSYAEIHLTTAVVDIDLTRMNQARTSSFTPALEQRGDDCVYGDHRYHSAEPEALPARQVPAWELSDHLKEEELSRAVALALFDYLRKSRSGGFVVSLSGGADSAAVACLVALMVGFAARDLGIDAFRDRLTHISGLEAAISIPDLVRRLLTCVYQATENSSETTRNAACAVAHSLGAEFLEWRVDALVGGYVSLVSQAVGRAISWDLDDIALQNIQARVRAPGVWLLANLRNALLLATSNRSEAAVGYATMDGDTCGGLSPIAGIDKHYLRKWLVWLERTGPDGLDAIPSLSAVNRLQPSAELRPAAAEQTDEDDLMPYPLLDFIERMAIRDKNTPLETFQLATRRFPEYSAEQLGRWVERFFQLFSRNQWKRERYAPSFHLDDENLDPRTWCRFPILSGGFELELRELRAYLAGSSSAPSGPG